MAVVPSNATRRGRTLSSAASAISTRVNAGVLLLAIGSQGFLGGWRHRPSWMMASAVTMSPTAVAAAEVQANGDISAASRAPGKVQGMEAEVGAWDGVPGEGKKRRVSSDVSVRFPVTSVEKQPERMVVIGDVHGDLGAFAETLRSAGLVDERGNWSGGETVLVQAGDIFDRGDADLEVEEWLWTLREQAEASGGAVYHLLGNHEVMNALGDHSTASDASYAPFQDLDVDLQLQRLGKNLHGFPDWAKARPAAMAPAGPVAKMLASHSVAMKIGDTLFVHGGLRPSNIDPKNCRGATGMACLENINRWTHEWLLGKGNMPRSELWSRESPLWSRYYSMPTGEELGPEAEAELQQVLDATGTVRMVVAHTPQEAGINSALGGRLWRTDTGMTAMIGGQPEALEFVDGVATILTAKGRIPGDKRACSAGRPLPHLPPISHQARKNRPGRVAPGAAANGGDGIASGAAGAEAVAAAA
ncbi:unnamed protein product [Ascophyllum nodosum]